jgi:hypothetical protein
MFPLTLPMLFSLITPIKRSFTEVILKEGTINTLFGLPGSGKTNCASYLMEPAVSHGFYVYTNIHFFSYEDIGKAIKLGKLPPGPSYIRKPDQIVTVTKISDLLEGLLTTRKNTTFIDEGGFFATSTMGTSKKVRQIKELAFIIRHLNSSLLLIAQARGSIVPDLRKTLVTYQLDINKISEYNRELTISVAEGFVDEDGEKDIRFRPIDRIGKIPMSKLPWDGYFLPKFKFDIDLTEAFDELGEFNSVEILKKGPEIIRKLRDKGVKEKEEDDAEEEAKATKKPKSVERVEVRELFMTLEESGMFKNRTDLCAHIADSYGKTMSWAYLITKSMPFDASKYSPSGVKTDEKS